MVQPTEVLLSNSTETILIKMCHTLLSVAYPGLSAETRAQVLEKLTSSPRKSVRRASGEIGVPHLTMQKVLKAEKFHPYKLQILHKLYKDDSDRRLEMAEWFQVLFSDEANFYVSGEVNRQNCRYYSRDNPHFMLDSKEHNGPKIMVCGATMCWALSSSIRQLLAKDTSTCCKMI